MAREGFTRKVYADSSEGIFNSLKEQFRCPKCESVNTICDSHHMIGPAGQSGSCVCVARCKECGHKWRFTTDDEYAGEVWNQLHY